MVAPILLMAGALLVAFGTGMLFGPAVAVFVAGWLLIVSSVAVAFVEDRRRPPG